LERVKKIENLISKLDIRSLPGYGYEHGDLGLGCRLLEEKRK
jgi:hypothetical protein